MYIHIYIYIQCLFCIASGCSIASGGPILTTKLGLCPERCPSGAEALPPAAIFQITYMCLEASLFGEIGINGLQMETGSLENGK